MKNILIITASGNATRLRPLTANMSKSMLPVNGKPVISYILDETINEYDHIVIVHNTNKDVPEFVKVAYGQYEDRITFVEQKEQIGVLYAAYLGCVNVAEIIGDEQCSVTVWLGDTIVTDYKRTPGVNELVVGAVPDYERWCMVGMTNDRAVYYDKPQHKPPTNTALVGIYSFNDFAEFMDVAHDICRSGVKVKSEYQMSQALERIDIKRLFRTYEWYDCGDFPSLYKSKARLLSRLARDDNSISIDLMRNSIVKSGKRCVAEREWYATINSDYPEVLPYIPQLYSTQDDESYEIAYCPGSTLQEIFAFENLRADTINYTIKQVLDCYSVAFGEFAMKPVEEHERLFVNDRIDRARSYDLSKYDFIAPGEIDLYIDYVCRVFDIIASDGFLCVSKPGHGDLHFGNIIFDYNMGSVKFIDPKGPIEIPYLYDMAKFYQSFYGDYLWIKSGVPVNAQVKYTIGDMTKWHVGARADHNAKLLVPVLMGSILDFHKDSPDHQKKIWRKTIDLIKEHEHEHSIL